MRGLRNWLYLRLEEYLNLSSLKADPFFWWFPTLPLLWPAPCTSGPSRVSQCLLCGIHRHLFLGRQHCIWLSRWCALTEIHSKSPHNCKYEPDKFSMLCLYYTKGNNYSTFTFVCFTKFSKDPIQICNTAFLCKAKSSNNYRKTIYHLQFHIIPGRGSWTSNPLIFLSLLNLSINSNISSWDTDDGLKIVLLDMPFKQVPLKKTLVKICFIL